MTYGRATVSSSVHVGPDAGRGTAGIGLVAAFFSSKGNSIETTCNGPPPSDPQ
jgi:hypothetical protein